MTPQEMEMLSCYEDITKFGPEQQLTLVQHKYTGKIYVRKILDHYNSDVYRYIIDHPVPNMPQVYAAIEAQGKLITIEDYIPGVTLQEELNAQGTLPEARVMDITLQLCRIVRQLHDSSPAIIHRDIKPENIMIGSDGAVRLLDMNAARQFENDKQEDTMLLGTAGFAAPEQYGFAQSDVRTDIYAIGVLMNVMLTGRFPKDKIADGQLRPIIIKCIQLDPGLRFASVTELLKALENPKAAGFLTKETHPAPAWRQFLPPGFRTGNPWSIIVGAVIYFILIWLGVTLKINSPLSAESLRLYRIFTTIMLLVMALFTGNYLNIQEKLPLTRSSKTLVRIFGILLVNFLIFAITIMLVAIALE